MVCIVNAHLFPFQFFNADATDKKFEAIYKVLDEATIKSLQQGPTIIGMDLNSDKLKQLLPNSADALQIAFEKPTIPEGGQQDFILASKQFDITAVQVLPTESDHYYCEVTLDLKT